MANNCTNCGGFLRYDIPSGQLKCDSCDSLFPVESYSNDTGAVQGRYDHNYEVTVYTCPNCGAEISSTDNTSADYCLYCGSFVTLDAQMAKIKKPDRIIPFARTKEDCIGAYRKMIAKNLYAPREFRNEEFLKGFKGIYIPYWSYKYEMGPSFFLPGENTHRQGDYLITQHYDVKCMGSGELHNLNYDASSTFDDSISARIADAGEERKKPFHPGYMFGFFADTADVEKGVYDRDADEEAEDILWNRLQKDSHVRDNHPKKPKNEKQHSVNPIIRSLKARRSASLTMLPVWFLTFRKGNQVAYSVVNGDTGEIYSEVPVDAKRYLLFSLLTAIPVFCVLNQTMTINGLGINLLSILLSLLFIILYSTELEWIVRKSLHIDDKGYMALHKNEEKDLKKSYSDNLITKVLRSGLHFFFKDGIMGYVFLVIAICTFQGFFVIGLIALALTAPVYSIYRIWKNQRLLNEPRLIADIAGSLFSLILGLVIFFTDPANDMFYYICGIICLLGIAWTAIRIMLRYNDVITRPVPHFFDRKEGEA